MKINSKASKNTNSIWNISIENMKSYCLSCYDKPCIRFNSDIIKELELLFEEFPIDRNYKVCPTNAIYLNEGVPIVNNDLCIFCGACISNCPANITTKGEYITITESLLEIISSRINKLRKSKKLNPNILVRNLLLSLGWKAGSYKEGVQYSSIDVLAKKDKLNLVVEVELDNQLIDTPRNLITYLALLVERHKWDKDNIKLLSIGMSLPNNREEFWNVIDDINNILNVKINISTILNLIYLVLTRKEFDISNDNMFFIETKSLRNKDSSLDNISLGYLGIFEPYK
ncbi:4Fe-4S binding protein [Aggregatibacter actinomycetemcomitans]|uniref:4Fe-4S binding protein n=1 Tax=Aggregatibacter actinomycetemcomitans TaxID=714 RepID=UPI001E4F404B|nr:4Fe-4S binding protein [Aggregatibacter actinomycetemcomitans]